MPGIHCKSNFRAAGGGTAVVYEGLDLKTGFSVALKVMSVKDGKAIVPIKGVRREIQYAASVQHENIVKLIDFVADEKQIVIVWELINGSDLLDLLNDRGGRLDEVQAGGYFEQLLQGVTFIHANGLCHRDLKPENCMIEKASDRLKIIDFGLSKHQQSAVTLGVGTPDYMAPELLGGTGGGFAALQERRVGHYDARACDVWAMGVLLYLLVTGQYPFEDPRQPQNVVATLQNIAAGRMRSLPSHISKECKHLIASMLNQDPLKRITLQEISKHPWLKKGCTENPRLEEPMDVDVEVSTKVSTEASHRFSSFSFPEQNQLSAKTTPVTPKMVVLNASPAREVAQQGLNPSSVASPTLSAPNTQGVLRSARGDLIVPVTPPQGGSDPTSKRSRLGGFCRMWFGTPKSLVLDC